MPRLANYSVLETAIRNGLDSTEYFGIADGKNEERYINLKYDEPASFIDKSFLLVKPFSASKQKLAEQKEQPITVKPSREEPEPPENKDEKETPAQTKLNTTFFMSAKLNQIRINRDVQRLVDEVISHLQNVDGAELEIALEVSVKAPNGIPTNTVRTVNENCHTLHVDDFGFDE